MGLNDFDVRKSSRIKDRANKFWNNYPPGHELIDIPFHRRLCLLNAPTQEKGHTPIKCDIDLPRAPINYDIEVPALSGRDMADEARIGHIETEVGGLKDDVVDLKAKVGDIGGKLDRILGALAVREKDADSDKPKDSDTTGDTDTPSPAKSTTHTSDPTTGGASAAAPRPRPSHHPAHINPHLSHLVRREMSAEEYIQKEMDRDKFQFQAHGKNLYSNDPFMRVVSKPYMYLHRDGVSTIKQKLELRHEMSAMEYIDATLALLADSRAYDHRDFCDIMFHLRKVSRDALERPWHAVRRWSNFVWDAIEAGDLTWADRDLIQEERVRLCLTCPNASGTQVQSQGASRTTQPPHSQSQELLCRAYNSRNGCQYRHNHTEAGVLLVHQCSYCDSVGKSCGHSVRDCERRINHARPFDNGQYPSRRPNQNSFQQFNTGQQGFYGQNPMFQNQQQYNPAKNGF